jgi:protochlorophyllide reductase
MVGSVTRNENTVAGGGVYPIADLHELEGFKAGFNNPIAMADGYGFIGAESYKDSKLCQMMMANYLYAKYHKLTGVPSAACTPVALLNRRSFAKKGHGSALISPFS